VRKKQLLVRLLRRFPIMTKFLNFLFVTMFGLGKIKFMPGTFGSLATVIILYIFFHILEINSNIIFFGLILIFFYSFTAVTYHTKNFENKDPREIIIDEFIGQSIPIYLYEISHGTEKHQNEAILIYAICFVLFRYFDIMKPFPVSYFDKKYKNSFGVIMDDVCAGFYVVLSLICFMVLKNYVL
jgi:phosphatidylglycerophosphatase A